MGMERDLLTLSQMQRPKDLQMLRLMPRPNHGGMGTTDMDGLTTLATTIMERDLLTLKDLLMLRLMPRPSHGGTGTTDMDGLTTLATTIMERDLPMLLPLLMPRLNLGTMAYGWPYYGGYHYYGKRSADSEPAPVADAKAEPWWYGHYGYTWPHYGYAYYGKRSADSEPTPAADAKAEPWYYGGYGYGWPHYGYYWG